MKTNSLKYSIVKFLLAIVFFIPFNLFAQTCTDPTDPTTCSGGDVDTPLDTYVIFLAIAVFLIGTFMIIRAKRNALNKA